MRFIVVCIFSICIFPLAKTSNILGIFPLPTKSHYVMFKRLMKGLADKGHNVDVVTHFPSEDRAATYNELSLEGTLPVFVNYFSFSTFGDMSLYEMLHFITKEGGLDLCQATLKSPTLQGLKTTKKKYDLVITEICGTDCMLGFGHFFKVPTIGLTSSINFPWGGDRIGNPDNPSYIPTYFAPSTDKMSLYQRLENTILLLSSKFLYDFFSIKETDKILREFFGPEIPSVQDLILNTSLVIVNSHFSMNYARPAVPNFIEVGGLHIKEPQPLSKHFEELVRSDSHGVILLSMGSLMRTETFEPEKLQAMFDAFSQLPYKVLWKGVREDVPEGLTIPGNIHFEKWIPQMDILCHPNVKLFVSHGGLMGSQEAVYCGVPRLGIPLFADQDTNIRSAEKMGIAIRLAYKDISKDAMLQAMQKLLKNPVYKQNAERVAQQFKDRPMSPLDTAIYWVEYVIRHNGAPHLRSAGADLPWYQYYLIDVGLIFIFFIFTIVYIIFLAFRFMYAYTVFKIKNKTD